MCPIVFALPLIMAFVNLKVHIKQYLVIYKLKYISGWCVLVNWRVFIYLLPFQKKIILRMKNGIPFENYKWATISVVYQIMLYITIEHMLNLVKVIWINNLLPIIHG